MRSYRVNSGPKAQILRITDGQQFEQLDLPLSAVEVIANGIKNLKVNPASLLAQYGDDHWVDVNIAYVD